MWRLPNMIGHYIAPTLSDVRGTSFEGPAGLNSIIPAECLKGGTLEKAYNKSTHELRLSNGSLIRGFGAVEEASRLRGPQAHAMACDEVAQWDRPSGNLERSLDNALFGLRLKYPDGTPARAVMATTPLPLPFLKRLEKQEGVRVVTGTSFENLDNLDDSYRIMIGSKGTETLVYKQEVLGLYIDEESDLSIIKRKWINLWPAGKKLPTFNFVIESYDPAASEENYDVKRQTTDPTACVVLGVFNVFHAFTEEERKRMSIKSKYAALLCDAWAERLGAPELLERARRQHAIKWGDPGKKSDIVLIENSSSGPGLRQNLVRYGVPTFNYNPGRENKTQRLHNVSPLISQGMFFCPESLRPDMKGQVRDWVEPLLEQLCAYAGPGSTEHDDFVDAISSAFSLLHDRGHLQSMPLEEHVDREHYVRSRREEDDARYAKSKLRPIINPYG